MCPSSSVWKGVGGSRGTHLAQVTQLNVHAAAQASADVGEAGAEVAQPLAPHELATLRLHQPLHLLWWWYLLYGQCITRK